MEWLTIFCIGKDSRIRGNVFTNIRQVRGMKFVKCRVTKTLTKTSFVNHKHILVIINNENWGNERDMLLQKYPNIFQLLGMIFGENTNFII